MLSPENGCHHVHRPHEPRWRNWHDHSQSRKSKRLSKQLISEISAALEEMQPPEVRVVIIRAAKGAKVFSAGHDVRELPTNGRDPLTYNDPASRRPTRNRDTCHTGRRHGGRFCLGRRLRAGDELRFDHGCKQLHVCAYSRQTGGSFNLSGTLNCLKVADVHCVKRSPFQPRAWQVMGDQSSNSTRTTGGRYAGAGECDCNHITSGPSYSEKGRCACSPTLIRSRLKLMNAFRRYAAKFMTATIIVKACGLLWKSVSLCSPGSNGGQFGRSNAAWIVLTRPSAPSALETTFVIPTSRASFVV